MSSNFKINEQKVFRTRLMVYPKFQITFLLVNLAITATCTLAVALLVNRSFNFLKNEGIAANLSANHAYFKFLEYQSGMVYNYLGGAFVLGFLISTFATLVLSNRLAGPIVRLQMFFSQIAEGRKPVSAVFFRKGDFFRDLPPVINAAVDRLQMEQSQTEATVEQLPSADNKNGKKAA